MRRRHIHLLFGLVALVFAMSAGYYGARLAEIRRAEASLAHALLLSRARDTEGAVQAYKALSRGEHGRVAQAALYNLGNLYLRQAIRLRSSDPIRSLPLLELAKQSYRDALRRNPDDWNARYNLERALWLAPEGDPGQIESRIQVDSEERVMSTLQGSRIDLP